MGIYSKDGGLLANAYQVNGSRAEAAYNREGEWVFPDTDSNFRVMTYNVGQWYQGDLSAVPVDKKAAYYALQYGTFEKNPVDAVFFQEYTTKWCDDGSSAAVDFVAPFFAHQNTTTPQAGTYKGRSIATVQDYPIANYTNHPFSDYKTSSYMNFQTAEITFEGKTIHLIDTHNDFAISYQRLEVTELLAAIEDYEYFILCGDFNQRILPGDTTNDYYQNSIQRFLDAGYNVGNGVLDWVQTYQNSDATVYRWLDQIVTSPNISIDRIRGYHAKLTDPAVSIPDHMPLIADLTIH